MKTESCCTYYSAICLFVCYWYLMNLSPPGRYRHNISSECAPKFIHQTICFQIVFFGHHKECVQKYVHVLMLTKHEIVFSNLQLFQGNLKVLPHPYNTEENNDLCWQKKLMIKIKELKKLNNLGHEWSHSLLQCGTCNTWPL